MESKDPMLELLSSLEQIVFKDLSQTVTPSQKTNPFTEFERLRKGTGLKIGIKTCKTLHDRAETDAHDSGRSNSQYAVS